MSLHEREASAVTESVVRGEAVVVAQTLSEAQPAPERSAELPAAVVEALRTIYDVGDWLAWRRTPKGRSNDSFFVTATSGRYVLRVSEPEKTAASMEFEMALLEHLRTHGYPAPVPIPTRRGERYVEHDRAFYLLTAFIPGAHCDPPNTSHLAAAGRALGRYHRLVKSFPGRHVSRLSHVLTRLWPDGPRRLGEARAIAAGLLGDDERARLDEACVYLERQFLDVHRALTASAPSLSRLIIHGSFGPTALLFERDALVGVLDYDRASWDLLGMDLASSLRSFCSIHDGGEQRYLLSLDEAGCRLFVDAYREEEPLPPDDIRALPLCFRAQRLRPVLSKCENFLAKNAVIPQRTKDAQKLASILERQAVRLRWLEQHGTALASALQA